MGKSKHIHYYVTNPYVYVSTFNQVLKAIRNNPSCHASVVKDPTQLAGACIYSNGKIMSTRNLTHKQAKALIKLVGVDNHYLLRTRFKVKSKYQTRVEALKFRNKWKTWDVGQRQNYVVSKSHELRNKKIAINASKPIEFFLNQVLYNLHHYCYGCSVDEPVLT
jgi:hypothetical protein